MKIGILALQGSVIEHQRMLKRCNVEPVLIKKPKDMEGISGLIIPGGESTTIGKLIELHGLDKAIKWYTESAGLPVYGTCAGAILLAKYILGSKQPSLSLMDISIKRNDYGRQVDSFETALDIEGFQKPFKGIFIRAPVIEEIHDGVKIMSTFNNKPVLARQRNLLVSTFHPELTKDRRVHQYFIDMINDRF